MAIIDLSGFQKLNEGVYPNAVLSKIVLEFDQDHPETPKWLDTRFTIEGHQVRDRFFIGGDERLGLFVESIKNIQGDLHLDDRIWSNMPCSVKLTQDEINGRMFWHTHDWKWDSEVHRQREQKLKQSTKQNTSQKILLEEMKEQSDDSDDDLFEGVFDKDSDNR